MAVPRPSTRPDRTAAGQGRARTWVPRIVALLALLGTVVAILLAVSTVESNDEVTGDEALAAMRELAAANGALSDRLDPLEAGDSPREAQEATRTTSELTRRLDEEILDLREGNEEGLADRMHAIYLAELTYLDAVGSTLANPKSPLRGRIGETAQALRDVLQKVPGGDHRAIRGGMALVLYSEARAGE